jgi:hypothetical protein
VCVLVEAFAMERVPIASPQCCFHPGLGALGTDASFPHGNGPIKSVTYIAMVFGQPDAARGIQARGIFRAL